MDNQKVYLSLSQDGWSDMSEIINYTQALKLTDEEIWNPPTNNTFYHPADMFFGNFQPQTLPYPSAKGTQVRPEYLNIGKPLEIVKSKSDYAYPRDSRFFPQQFEQKPTHFSPYLPPTTKKSGTNTVLKLQAISKQPGNLVRETIFETFSKYENLVDVVMQSNDCALIIFSNPSSASQAELIFNQQQFINENNVNLSLTFCNEIESQYAWERSKQDKLLMTAKQNYKESSPMVSSTLNTSFSPSPTFALKYTCKYEIQIENERDFQVARRIIGSKGYNMKRIIQLCQKNSNNSYSPTQFDLLKLRLRGRGSGFKEGPEKKESDEPLHLCISSKDQETYQKARELVEELLRSVYKEYSTYCLSRGRALSEKLEPKCIESIPNKENPYIQPKENLAKQNSNQPMYSQYGNQENRYVPEVNQQAIIEQLISAFIKARQEDNFPEVSRISNQLKVYGISLSDDLQEKGGIGMASWDQFKTKY